MDFSKCFLSFYIKWGKGGALVRKKGAKELDFHSALFIEILAQRTPSRKRHSSLQIALMSSVYILSL